MEVGSERVDWKEIETPEESKSAGGEHKEEEEEESLMRVPPPPWTKQITVRGVVASVVIGALYSVIAMKINLSVGPVPNLNISAALFAFVFMWSWTKVLHRAGIVSAPFTVQENTMIQTCSVACYSMAEGGHLIYSWHLFFHWKTCLTFRLISVGLLPDGL